MAKNHIGMTTGNLAAARLHKLLHSCMPMAFSQTKYNGVHANPNVMNCRDEHEILIIIILVHNITRNQEFELVYFLRKKLLFNGRMK